MSSLWLGPGQGQSFPWVWGPQTTLGNSSPAVSDTWLGQVQECGRAVLAVGEGCPWPRSLTQGVVRVLSGHSPFRVPGGLASATKPSGAPRDGSLGRDPGGRGASCGCWGSERLHVGPGGSEGLRVGLGSEAGEGRLGAHRDRTHLTRGCLTCRVSSQFTPSRGDSSPGDGILSVTVPMGEREQLVRTTSSGPRPAAHGPCGL